MRNVIVVDSGPLIALFDRDDAWHGPVVNFLRKHPGLRLFTTWAVLNETSALLGSRVGKQAELDFLAWVERGGLAVASQEAAAIQGIRALVEKYRDLPFDFADASVAVLAAEAGISQVLTLDRDFDIYRDARGKRLKNLLVLILARSR
jgi:predicted nucleic acid-binding protein